MTLNAFFDNLSTKSEGKDTPYFPKNERFIWKFEEVTLLL
jgi:hypothetical protein